VIEPLEIETAIIAGCTRALRTRADVQRRKAAVGVTRNERATIITSEAAAALRLALDIERIADDIEREAR
jgi:hypothetical protein